MPIHSLNSYLVSDSTKYSKKKQTYKKNATNSDKCSAVLFN